MAKTLYMAMACAVACWSICSSALAQTAPTPPSAASPESPASPGGLLLPKLRDFVQATYPEGFIESHLQTGFSGTVGLELIIGLDGAVTDVKVVAPLEPTLDVAAQEAARRFKFEPATRDGKPIAAKIRYNYVFEVKATPRITTGALSLTVLDAVTGAALANTQVQVKGVVSAQTRTALTSAQGQAKFEELPKDEYEIIFNRPGYLPFRLKETVDPGEQVTATYRLTEKPDTESFGATARIEAPPREVTRRTIEGQELTRIAGTRGDALRAVELLPGVGRPPFTSGLLIIRGASPQDSQFFFEGVPVPLVYHFGGVTSVINSRLIDSIDFVPGNFSARYGRLTGGVIEIQGREPGQNGVHAVADINIIDASLMVETPLGKKAGVGFAARRSYIDFFFDKLLTSDSLSSVAAPVYYDYQAFGWYKPTPYDKLKFSFYGSNDRLKLFLNEPSDSNPRVRGNFGFGTSFTRVQASWQHIYAPWLQQRIDFSIGTNSLDFGAGEQSFRLDLIPMQARGEWKAQMSSKLQLITGMDIQWSDVSVGAVGNQPRQQEGNPSGPGGSASDPIIRRFVETTAYRPAAYVEALYRPIDPWLITAGLRLDYYKEIRSWSVDPRLTTRYRLTDQTTVKAGVGWFSQPPQFAESDPGVGNPNLKPFEALHLSTGVDHQWTKVISTGAEVFYKHLTNRIVSTAGSVPPFFINDGTGNIYGLELSARAKPKGRFFGYLSYTLSRSERQDRDDVTRLFDYDQTHILTVAAVYRLGKGWEASSTFRLVSGNPYTPVVSSVYNANADIYQPLYGAINSLRNPLFHRLDVRIEKLWRFNSWKLAAYLDVQNIYNAENREGVTFSYDFQQSSNIRGLPIIPSLGVRAEL